MGVNIIEKKSRTVDVSFDIDKWDGSDIFLGDKVHDMKPLIYNNV